MTDKEPNEMTEQELAAFYEGRKGDTSLWKRTPRLMRRRRGEGPSTSFAVRLTPDEIEVLHQAARVRGTTLSDFIRTSALSTARGDPDKLTDHRAIEDVKAKLRELEEAANRL